MQYRLDRHATTLLREGQDYLRFCEKILVEDACWRWTGTISAEDYGVFHIATHPCAAHRVSWKLFRGVLLPEDDVLHTCDNRACVYPDHMFLGDQALNMADKTAKGRQSHGEGHGRAKLTDAIVLAMRVEYAESRFSFAERALRYDVDPAAVRRAVLGMTWRHLNG